MSEKDQDFAVFLGRDSQPTFTVVNSAGAPMDLSGVQDIEWNCQLNLDDDDILIDKKKSTAGEIVFVTDGTDGKFQVILTPSDTSTLAGFYMHQAWVTDSTGLKTEVASGRMRVGRAPAWTYSGDPRTSTKDQIRFLVGDTNHKDQQCSDGEINYALQLERSSPYAAAAAVARAIGLKYARDVDSVQNDLRTMWSSRARNYASLALQLEAKASRSSFAVPYAGGISISDKRAQDANTDRVQPQFNIGMDDNYLPVGPVGNETMLRGELPGLISGVEVSTEPAFAQLDQITPRAQAGLRAGVSKATIDLQGGVREAVENIFHSTGPLYKSIGSEMEESPGEVTGTVYSKDVVYDAAQEYGGTWTIPEIFPVNAQALAFPAMGKIGFSSGGGATGGTIFAKHTKAHPVTLPARSYARSTLFRMRGQIADDVREATAENI